MKKVRMLLRVSSNQQLEADGDLSIQRQLVEEYISKNQYWTLDKKEYFEGSNSGYKNSVEDRDVLQDAMNDAQNKEYDILVAYKDDRIGRRMWEIGAYVMQLKQYGVDICTVKDGLISPETDDIMGQMILALRYGNAQKSSSDTGMRVKDTAQKLVQKGKFMGGKAPYGYELVYSGEISKHGRALKKLQIVDKQAEIVKEIYNLAITKEFGSTKIAKILNDDPYYLSLAPNDFWKSGTITSILTNPIYTGIVAYKRREKRNEKYHKLSNKEWIKAEIPNESIAIIEKNVWDMVQDKRVDRSKKYTKSLENQNVTIIKKNDGKLCLIDVIYCGYCGAKLTNGNKYNYWSIKETGERKTSLATIYKCNNSWSGVPHKGIASVSYKAEEIEKIIVNEILKYISVLGDNTQILKEINSQQESEKELFLLEISKKKKELVKIENGINIIKSHIPDAMIGDYVMTIEELTDAIRLQNNNADLKRNEITSLQDEVERMEIDYSKIDEIKKSIPSWIEILNSSDGASKRVIINKIVKRIGITKENINIKYRINLNELL